MNLVELQILFQQKIEDVNILFMEEDRPDTFTIVNCLNKSITQYLAERYLSLPTFEQRLIAIDQNFDELAQLIKKHTTTETPLDFADINWSTRAHKYVAPEDILIPVSMSCSVTRTEVYPYAGQKVFAQFVSRRQAERVVSNTADKVMLPTPLALWNDKYYITLIGDAYTTSIGTPILTYLKKPYSLSYDYTEITTEGLNNIATIPDDTYFIMHSYSQYVDALGAITNYDAGSKVLKIADHDTVTKIQEDIKVGYPWGDTDTPEFPAYLHDKLVENAVSIFLDEAKLKLVPKEN